MKNHIGLLALLISAQAYSQIQITSADFPQAGERWVEYYDDNEDAHPLPATGPGRTWLYANAFNVTDSLVNVYELKGSQPGSSNFPSSNLVMIETSAPSFVSYFRSTANGFYLSGNYDNSASTEITKPSISTPEELLFPTLTNQSIGSTQTNVSKSVSYFINSPNTVSKLVTSTNTTARYVGWGALSTPVLNSVPSVLYRIRKDYLDSTFTQTGGAGPFTFTETTPVESEYTYYFLKKGPGTVGMIIYYDSTDAFTFGATYFKTTVTTSVSTTKANPKAVTVFPNPSTGGFVDFRIQDATVSSISVTDALGRNVLTQKVESANRIRVSTAFLEPGVYHYHLQNADNGLIGSGHFSVLR